MTSLINKMIDYQDLMHVQYNNYVQIKELFIRNKIDIEQYNKLEILNEAYNFENLIFVKELIKSLAI